MSLATAGPCTPFPECSFISAARTSDPFRVLVAVYEFLARFLSPASPSKRRAPAVCATLWQRARNSVTSECALSGCGPFSRPTARRAEGPGVSFECSSSGLGGGLEGTQLVLVVGEWVRAERKQGAWVGRCLQMDRRLSTACPQLRRGPRPPQHRPCQGLTE